MNYDPAKCDKCGYPAVAYNEDGNFLCEDCLFEEQCWKDFPPEDELDEGDEP
jgi:hypothetical protein